MAGILIRAYLGLCLALGGSGVFAQRPILDPMRPPAAYSSDPQDAEGDDRGPLPAVLQSVIVPSKGKPVAIIGGLQVRLGDKFGESRLVRLSEQGAVLVGPNGTEHLPLTPMVEKVKTKNNGTPVLTAVKNETQAKGGR